MSVFTHNYQNDKQHNRVTSFAYPWLVLCTYLHNTYESYIQSFGNERGQFEPMLTKDEYNELNDRG